MKQFEIRKTDLNTVIFTEENKANAISFFDKPNQVLVSHEFESEAEANKARQDWLEEHYEVLIYSLCDTPMNKLPPTCREIMDSHRNPPKPTLIILAAPDGWEIPEVQGYVVVDGRE